MANLKDDHIKWILDLDAGGLQKELTLISTKSNALAQDNIRLGKEIKEVTKQMNDAEKQMIKCTKAGDTSSNTYHEAAGTYREAKVELADYQKRVESNTKTINDNNTKVQEVIRSMKLEDMTMGQLKIRAGELQRQFDNTSKSASPTTFANLEKQLKATHDQMNLLNGKTKEVQSTFSLKGFAESALSGWAMVLAGAMKVGEFFTSMTEDSLAAEKSMQRLGFAVKTVGHGSDSDLAEMAKQAEELMGIFSHEEIEKTATQMTNFGLSTKQVLTLMPLMVDAAAASGQSLDDMATAVDKGTVNGVMARSALGKLGLAFKDTGDRAENFRIIQEGLTKFTGGNTEAMKSQWGQIEANKIKWEDVKEVVGNGLLKVWIPLVKVLSNVSDGLAKLLSVKEVTKEFNEQNLIVHDLTTTTTGLIDRYDTLTGKTKLSRDEQTELKKIIKEIGTTIPDCVTQFDKLGNAISISGDKARKFVADQVLLLKYTKKDAIENTENTIKQLEAQKKVQESQSEYTRSIYEKASKQEGEQGAKSREKLRKFNTESLKEEKALDDLIAGAKMDLSNMNGNTLKKELAEREKANKETGAIITKEQKTTQKASKETFDFKLKLLEATTQAIAESEKREIEVVRTSQQKKVDELDKAYGKGLVSLEQYNQLKKAYQESSDREVLDIQIKYNEKRIKEAVEATNKLIKGQVDSFGKYLTDTDKDIDIMYQTNLKNADYEFALKQIQNKNSLKEEKAYNLAKRQDAVNKAKGGKEEIAKINAYYDAVDKKADDDSLKSKIANVLKYADTSNNVLSGASNFTAALGARELANWAKINKGKANFDAEYAAKKAKIDHDTAVRAKALNLVSAIINTARAVAEALPNIPLSILAGIAGALEIGTILATPIPDENTISTSTDSTSNTTATPVSTGSVQVNGYADGGYTGNGGKYEVAGYTASGQTFHKGEYFVAQDEMRNPETVPLVRKLEAIRRRRTSSNPLPDSGYADGGYNDSPAGNSTQNANFIAGLEDWLTRLKETKLKAELNYHEFKYVETVVDDSYALGQR